MPARGMGGYSVGSPSAPGVHLMAGDHGFLRIIVDDEGARLAMQGLMPLDLTSTMQDVGPMLVVGIQYSFDQQGGPEGSWVELTSRYAARKARMGLDPRILFATGAMNAALSWVADSLSADAGAYGIVYAAAMNFGRPEINLPARPFVTPWPEVIDHVMQRIGQGIVQLANASGYGESGYSKLGTRYVA
jgi:phage gpG-like protein